MKGAVVAFNVEGLHPHDGAALLDQEGIAVRRGLTAPTPDAPPRGRGHAARELLGPRHTRRGRAARGRGGDPARHAPAAPAPPPMDPSREHPRQRDGFASPRFAQPATFMRLPHLDRPPTRRGPLRHPLRRRQPVPLGRPLGAAPDPRAVLADPPVEPCPPGAPLRAAPDCRLRRHRHRAGLDRGDLRRPSARPWPRWSRRARSALRGRRPLDGPADPPGARESPRAWGSCTSTRTRTPGIATSACATSTAPRSGARSRSG